MARVLICEPDPDIQSLIAFVARRSGHEPVISDGTFEQAQTADVAVLEPGNPDMLALARRLNSDSPGFPIVCVSIYPSQDEIAPLRPVSYLVKPFSLDELGGSIADAVALAERHQAPTPGQTQRPPMTDVTPAPPSSAAARPMPEMNSQRPKMRARSTALADLCEDISIEDLEPLRFSTESEALPEDWRIRLAAVKRRREFVLIVGGAS